MTKWSWALGLAAIVALLAGSAVARAQEAPEAGPPPMLARQPPEEAAPAAEATAPPADAEAPKPPQIVAVPEPDLSGLEPEVAQQLSETRGQLEALFNRPGAQAAERAEAYGELGRVYHAYGLTGPAEIAYVDAYQLAPGEYRWAYYLAYLYQQEGQYENAAALYGRALETQQTVAAVIHLAEVYIALERLDDAEKVLRYALSGAPDLPSARALLGQIALSRKDYALAVDYLEAAIAAVPDATRLNYPLALAYRGLGDLDKAKEHLEKRGEVGVRPADPLVDELEELKQGEQVHVFRGRTAFRAGDFNAAVTEFRMAVEAHPDSVPARVNLGSALGQAGDRIGAMHQFRRVLELDERNVAAHFNLGLLLGLEGKAEESVEHLARAAELEPRDGEIRRELAKAQFRSGHPEAALESYQRASDLAPFDPETRLGEVQLLVDLGRYGDARSRLDDTYSLLPREPRVVDAYARLLAGSPDASERDGEKAVEVATGLFQAEPTTGHGQTLAMALAEAGRCDEAADMLGRVIDTYRQAGETSRLEELNRTVERYRAGAPCGLPSVPES